MPYLTEDIKSSFNPHDIYGRKGDEVILVSDEHGDVVIVQGKDGRVFPAHKYKLGSNQIDSIQLAVTKKLFNQCQIKKRGILTLYKSPHFSSYGKENNS